MRLPSVPSTAAALIQGVEGGALVGLAAYIGVETVLGGSRNTGSAVAVILTVAVLGLGALVVCLGLYQSRRWSRAPAVLTQIFALPVAVTFFRSARPEVGVPLALAAVAALVLLVHPRVGGVAGEGEQQIKG